MLQQMREWFRYLKWVLAVVVFMFIWWAFAAWSGGASGVRREDTVNWAAKVNGTVIEAMTFQSYARQLESTYQSIFGDQFAQQRGLMRIGQQAINQLVDDELLYQAAAGAGLRVSPDEVAQAITRDPSFQENGHFIGIERYRNLFRGARMSLGEFEEHVRRRSLVEKYRSLIGNGVSVSDAEVEKEFLRRNQRTSVDWVVIPPKSVREGARPDDAAITAWYGAHKDRYMRGEGRTGIYVLVSVGDASAAPPGDAEARAAYDRDLASRYSIKEQRRASHILFKIAAGASDKEIARIEAKAQEVLKKARSGGDFGDLARRYSEDSTASAGGDLNFFGRGQMVKEFEDAAFSLKVGAISDLVRTTFGFHIIKVTEERAPRTVPFDEVKDTIKGEIANARSRSAAVDRAAALAAAAAGGRLEAAAHAQGLKTVETGPVRSGDALGGLPASQPAVVRMLALQPGQTSESIAIPSGQVVVQVTGTVPDEPRPLADVKSAIEREILDESRRTAIRDAAKAAGAGALASLAKTYKTEVKHQDDLARGAGLPGVPRDEEINRQIETLSPGVPGDPVVTSAGIVLLAVRERRDHREELAAQKDSTRDSLVTQQRDRLIRAFVQQLHDQGSVEVNRTLVDSIDRS